MISAIVLAAGQSKRMGSPKMTLPWGDGTVIGASIRPLTQNNIDEIIVVCGDQLGEIEKCLGQEWPGANWRCVLNQEFQNDDLVRSLKVGLASISSGSNGILVCLGDQPQLEVRAVKAILASYQKGAKEIIVPSWMNRRGHPWFLPANYFADITTLPTKMTLRDFLRNHADEIKYVDAGASVLKDMDTPEQYKIERP